MEEGCANTTTSNTTPTINPFAPPLTIIVNRAERRENRASPCFANPVPPTNVRHNAHAINVYSVKIQLGWGRCRSSSEARTGCKWSLSQSQVVIEAYHGLRSARLRQNPGINRTLSQSQAFEIETEQVRIGCFDLRKWAICINPPRVNASNRHQNR